MTPAGFLSSLPFVLRWENGYVDNPDDPGGATNRGITQRVYNDWRSHHGLGVRDVRLIDDEELRAIYQTCYWVPPQCDLLSGPLDLVQFDTAVNMGVGRAIRMLQASLGCLVDGDFGPGTQHAADTCDIGTTVKKYCERRESYYRTLAQNNPRLAIFLKGWINRLNALRRDVGLPDHEAAVPLDLGDTDHIAKIPDPGVHQTYDF